MLATLAFTQVSGIEGNFRTTCENVMRVLRSNKESVTAMLEAFVHDPLINWRLLNTNEATAEAALRPGGQAGGVDGMESAQPGKSHLNLAPPPCRASARPLCSLSQVLQSVPCPWHLAA